MEITLRKSIVSDLEVFFLNQTDEDAIFMAAFTPADPHDKAAYLSKYTRLLKDDTINSQTILMDGEIAGCVSKFILEGRAEITYAVGKGYWGKGVTSLALRKFLEIERTRPIFGRVAFDNYGSQKVLERNGFKRIGEDTGFANARGKEIREFIYRLDG